VGAHADGFGALDIDRAVVDEQSVLRLQTESVEREVVDGRIGLQQLHFSRHDDVAEAGEEGLLPLVERRPEIGREVGDGEKRNTVRLERCDDLVNAGDGIADGLAEPLAPGGDQVGIFGEFPRELGRRLGIGTAAVERLVPVPQTDILDELEARGVVRDLADEEGIGIPAVEDVADVEDDGSRSRAQASPGAP
jgi:hypothetical protein